MCINIAKFYEITTTYVEIAKVKLCILLVSNQDALRLKCILIETTRYFLHKIFNGH